MKHINMHNTCLHLNCAWHLLVIPAQLQSLVLAETHPAHWMT